MRNALTFTRTTRSSALRVLGASIMVLGVLMACSAPAQPKDQGIQDLRQMGRAFASVAKSVSPGVVFIRVDKTVRNQPVQFFGSERGDPFRDDFLRRFFGNDDGQPQHLVGQGSGFVISPKGYILTNDHVIGEADKVTVTLQDGRVFTAKTIGTDPQSDVAVIKIEADKLNTLPLGDSDSLVTGEWVIAVGNPFGLSHTITAGIVSATGRSSVGITDYEDFIQTDAAINPGNSGGPLVDLEGKVIGMNTAIAGGGGGNVGVGFAIPIKMAKAISDQLITHGAVTRGYLGVIIQDVTPDLAKSFGLDNSNGVVVSQVMENSPGSKAGLQEGDVILTLSGQPVVRSSDLRNEIAMTGPGKKMTLVVLRDGKRQSLDVTIGTQPSTGQAERSTAHAMSDLGFSVQNLTPDLARELGLRAEKGVVVTHVDPGSAADLAGMRPGVLIEEVNRKPVANTGEFKAALAENKEHAPVLLLIKDGEYSRYAVLKTG